MAPNVFLAVSIEELLIGAEKVGKYLLSCVLRAFALCLASRRPAADARLGYAFC